MSTEVLHDTTGKKEAVVYYMDTPLPYAIEENFGGCFFEDDVDLAQVLQDQVLTEDGVDPDNMTYEELQQLGETIGTET
eukprot:UN06290